MQGYSRAGIVPWPRHPVHCELGQLASNCLCAPKLSVAPVEAGLTALEDLTMRAKRIQVDDKKILNCRADLNQMVPFKYKWAWEKYLAACNNHRMPQEIA